MSSKRIFISRQLEVNSPFFQLSDNYSVQGTSLIEFSAIPFNNSPKTDWIFFYSKNAIRFFLASLPTILNCKYACFGSGTADFLAQQKISPHFIGTGKKKSTAKAFLSVAAHQKVLFPRAKNSRQSIQKILGNDIEAIDLIVYDNQPKVNIELNEADILIFTSPMNALAYFSIYDFKTGQIVIAIGKTTKKTLKKLGIKNVLMPTKPSEKALVDLVLSNRF